MPPSAPGWHERPARQPVAIGPPPVQHAWPVPPHATHIIVEHCAPEAVQVAPPPVPQQAWPTAPHAIAPVPHEPLLHVPAVPPPMHIEPAAVHSPPMQQPPLLQVLAAQHACPGPPHVLAAPPVPAWPPP